MQKLTLLSRVWWTDKHGFQSEVVVKGQVEPLRTENAVLIHEVEVVAYVTLRHGDYLPMVEGAK